MKRNCNLRTLGLAALTTMLMLVGSVLLWKNATRTLYTVPAGVWANMAVNSLAMPPTAQAVPRLTASEFLSELCGGYGWVWRFSGIPRVDACLRQAHLSPARRLHWLEQLGRAEALVQAIPLPQADAVSREAARIRADYLAMASASWLDLTIKPASAPTLAVEARDDALDRAAEQAVKDFEARRPAAVPERQSLSDVQLVALASGVRVGTTFDADIVERMAVVKTHDSSLAAQWVDDCVQAQPKAIKQLRTLRFVPLAVTLALLITLLFVAFTGNLSYGLAAGISMLSVVWGTGLQLDWSLHSHLTLRYLILRHLSAGLTQFPVLLVAPFLIVPLVALCAARWGETLYWRRFALHVTDRSFSLGRYAAAIVALAVIVYLATGPLPALRADILILLYILLAARVLAQFAWFHGAATKTELLLLLGPAVAGCVTLWSVGDMGHVLLLAGLAAVVFSMRMPLKATIAGAALASVVAVTVTPVPDPLNLSRTKERTTSPAFPLTSGPSDLARLRFFMQSAGLTGYRNGETPWLGLQRPATALPRQTQSDYAIALAAGQAGVLGMLMALLAGVAFPLLIAMKALASAAATGNAPKRFVAYAAGIACVMLALRSLVSYGGSTTAHAMTGVPYTFLAFGSSWFFAVNYVLFGALIQKDHPKENIDGDD